MDIKLCCDEVDELYTDYAEGLLESCDMIACDKHFETCAACRSNLVIIKGIVSALGEMNEEEVPLGFSENVSDAITVAADSNAGFVTNWLDNWAFVMRRAVVLAPLMVIIIIAGYFSMSKGPVMPGKLAPLNGSSERLAGAMTLTEGTVILDGLQIIVNGSPVAVSSGQEIEHYRGSIPAKMILGDGSVVLLSRRALVSIESDKLVLQKGRLDLSMTPNGVGFVVTTPHADVIVRGTVYSVEVGAATRVAVSNGAVAVESRLGGESVLLQKGDKVSVLSSGKLRKIIDTESLADAVIPTVVPSDEAENTNIGISDSN